MIARCIVWSTVNTDVRQMLRRNLQDFRDHDTEDEFPRGWARRLGELYNTHVAQAAADKLKKQKAKQAEKRKKKCKLLKKQATMHSRGLERLAEELRVVEQMDDSDIKVEDN